MIIIGHRGASGYEPENTLSSFKKAIEMGVDMIECDVHQCASGEIVVIHDATVNRTTNGEGFIHEKTLKEIKQLKTTGNEQIPTLQETLDCINRKVTINIELKGKNTALAVATIIKKYIKEKNWKYDDFLISSFNHHELKYIKELIPEIKIAPLLCSLPIDYAKCASALNAYSIHLSNEAIDEHLINDAHQRDLKVYVYIINNTVDLEKIKNLNIDGFFTDFPNIIF